jgi:hypothetical protein
MECPPNGDILPIGDVGAVLSVESGNALNGTIRSLDNLVVEGNRCYVCLGESPKAQGSDFYDKFGI